MKKRKPAEEGGSNWMDTYGDMVTLLLCFFVLLYSISSVDQAKWEMVVKSFNPNAKHLSQIVTDENVDGDDDVPGGVPEGEEKDPQLQLNYEFDDLFEKLKEAVETAGMQGEVELYKGDGYTFVTFRDNVFFAGDSSIIKDEGKAILDQFAQAITVAQDSIKEIKVLGHTSQALPDQLNDVESDRILSSERAARVAAYIQLKSLVTPDKLVSVGYGQFRPIAPFDTMENRAKNRRVELLITKTDSVEQSLDQYYQQMNK